MGKENKEGMVEEIYSCATVTGSAYGVETSDNVKLVVEKSKEK